MSNPNQFCIEPEAGDNGISGSKAINNKYLVIGNSKKNRVLVYSHNDSGQWIKTKEILPPKNSIPYKYGEGFGRNVQLDGDTVLIYASINRETTKVTNPEDFQYIYDAYTLEVGEKIEDFKPSDKPRFLFSVFRERYLAKLDSDEGVQTLEFTWDNTPGFKRFTVLSEEKLKEIKLASRGEQLFGNSFAFKNNLALVGSPSYYTGGGGWLYDLEQPELEPTRLSLPNTLMGETLALSNEFAVVGAYTPNDEMIVLEAEGAPEIPRKTLVRAIENGSTTVLEDLGELSISGNILAIMRHYFPFGPISLLKVFRLDKDATPHLIIEREYLNEGWVQNGFLVTSESNYFSDRGDDFVPQLCIEAIN